MSVSGVTNPTADTTSAASSSPSNMQAMHSTHGMLFYALLSQNNSAPVTAANAAKDPTLVQLTKLGYGTITKPTTTVTMGVNLQLTTPVSAKDYIAYDPNKNMASGTQSPDFFKSISAIDPSGKANLMEVDFLKTGDNEWAVEVVASPATALKDSANRGQIAYGTLTFNPDGSLASVSPSLSNVVSIPWANSPGTPGKITFNWGTVGKTDGTTQYVDLFSADKVAVNGLATGKLIGMRVGTNRHAMLSYDNGMTKTINLPKGVQI